MKDTTLISKLGIPISLIQLIDLTIKLLKVTYIISIERYRRYDFSYPSWKQQKLKISVIAVKESSLRKFNMKRKKVTHIYFNYNCELLNTHLYLSRPSVNSFPLFTGNIYQYYLLQGMIKWLIEV